MDKDEALKLALCTLNEVRSETFRLLRNGEKLYAEKKVWDTIFAIKEALARPEQEPVAFVTDNYSRDGVNDEISAYLPVGTKIYTTPPKRKPLTDDLKDAFFEGFTSVVTYNDTWQNSPEEAWSEYKAAHGIKE